ncbi:MAG: hypothetical protein ACRC7S_05535 [Cetobacterium sp.]
MSIKDKETYIKNDNLKSISKVGDTTLTQTSNFIDIKIKKEGVK